MGFNSGFKGLSQKFSDCQKNLPKNTPANLSEHIFMQSIWTPSNTTCLENLKPVLFINDVFCQEYKTWVIDERMEGLDEMEHWRKNTTKRNTAALGENPLPLLLCLQQIPHRLA